MNIDKIKIFFRKFKSIFHDYIAYDLASLPRIMDGGAFLKVHEVLRIAEEKGILLYTTDIGGNKPELYHRGLFSFRKIVFIEWNDLTVEQKNKIIKKL